MDVSQFRYKRWDPDGLAVRESHRRVRQAHASSKGVGTGIVMFGRKSKRSHIVETGVAAARCAFIAAST